MDCTSIGAIPTSYDVWIKNLTTLNIEELNSTTTNLVHFVYTDATYQVKVRSRRYEKISAYTATEDEVITGIGGEVDVVALKARLDKIADVDGVFIGDIKEVGRSKIGIDQLANDAVDFTTAKVVAPPMISGTNTAWHIADGVSVQLNSLYSGDYRLEHGLGYTPKKCSIHPINEVALTKVYKTSANSTYVFFTVAAGVASPNFASIEIEVW